MHMYIVFPCIYRFKVTQKSSKFMQWLGTAHQQPTLCRATVVAEVVVAPVHLLQLQELLHSLGGHPGLHQPIDHPGERVQRADEDVE